jgi:redox-sensitive bicupin YhaK (pirin superfamily)
MLSVPRGSIRKEGIIAERRWRRAGDHWPVHEVRCIRVAGRPLYEAIVQYGLVVMNTRAEVERAMADYRSARPVQKKAGFVGA